MAGIQEEREAVAGDLGGLLDAGDGAIVTLVAGDTQLAAHRAVLAARSPVFADKFAHGHQDNTEIVDMEGQVLRQLLSFIYTYQAPQLSSMAPQLLAAACKYDVAALKAQCEQQVACDLSVENAAAAAVLAVQHSCQRLRESAVALIRAHNFQVMATKGWADAVLNHPKELVEVSRLLAAEVSAPAPSGNKPTTSDRPQSDHGQAAAAATPPHQPQTPPPDATSSRLRNMSGEEKRRRLIQAAEEGAVEELRALLAEGADLGAGGWLYNTALHRAVHRGNMEAVSCLLQAAVEVDVREDGRLAPLAWAAQSCGAPVGRRQAEACADPSARGEDKWTPLLMEAVCDYAEEAITLLEAAADVEITNNSGRNISQEDKRRRLLRAAKDGAVGELQALLSAGTDVGVQDNFGSTALHWAAINGHEGAVRCLLRKGAEVNARNRGQITPLHWAAMWGRTAVVRQLVAASADLSARDEDGRTPLHCAALFGHAETAAALLEAGADTGIRDNRKRTPLLIAEENNKQQLVDILRCPPSAGL